MGRGLSTSRDATGDRPGGSRAGDAGVIAVITALLATVLFVFAAIAVDVGRWYSEGQRLQRAVDAAALAGAPYLPGDLTRARAEARALLEANGYDASVVPDDAITIGDRPSRLQVRVSSTIPNAFGTVVGARYKTVTRTAVADFAATVTMGSSCATLGTDPEAPADACSAPGFWNSVAGPETFKVWGDRYASRTCQGGESNCAGTRNLDFAGGDGIVGQSYYVYRIRTSANVSRLTVQAFDPMFVDVGNHCEIRGKLRPGPLAATDDPAWELGPTPAAPDASRRYAWGDAMTTPTPTVGDPSWSFCTGDSLAYHAPLPPDPSAEQLSAAQEAELRAAQKLTTTFLVVDPTDTLDPMRSTPVGGCRAESFGGFSGDLTQALDPASPGFVPEVAQSFRQWVPLCTIYGPQVDRDYYLIVRTNVPGGVDASRVLDPADDPSTGGDGFNRFGLRVLSDAPAAVSMAAVERLPIFTNLSRIQQFPLARVTSANAGGVLTAAFFDTGDSSEATSIQITAPSGAAPQDCTATGDVRESPSGDFNPATCTLSNVSYSTGYQGQIQRIQIPIPSDYSCVDADPRACWYRLTITTPVGTKVTDQVTWSASLDGDPVRLVQ